MKRIFLAYWPSLRTYWRLFALTTIFMIVSTALETIFPYFIREIVDVFTEDVPDISKAYTTLKYLGIFYIFMYAAHRAFDICISAFELYVMKDLDRRSFSALQAQDVHFFQSNFAGSLQKRITRFRDSFEGIADAFFFQIGKNACLILFVLFIFFRENATIAGMFLVWILIFMWINIRLAIWKYPLDADAAESDSHLSGSFSDSISNHATVKSYAMEKGEDARIGDVLYENFCFRWKSWFAHNTQNFLQGAIMMIFELLVLYVMIRGWEQGTVTVGDFVFFNSYMLWLFSNLWDFGNNLRRVFNRLADAEEMTEIYNRTPIVEDKDYAEDLAIPSGNIEIKSIAFAYPEEKNGGAIKTLTLDIPSNVSTAFVGKSGAGKTTVVKLLMRYFDVNEGSISIDGQDIRDVTQESLRRQIALVPQDPEIFHRSLRENIRFARPDATEEEIILATKRAHAWEFIEKLDDGLDTIVGERGLKLSGGQRQRVALARAFLADTKILILDEATSALDSETEKLIQDAISDLLRDRTSIVIAHRLSTVMRMDRIVVMDEGAIAEIGTHDELLAKNGIYTNLWNRQSGGYIE